MTHEEQNDPVAQSSMYQRRPPNLEASTADDLSERDIKENLVVKEEETNDTEVFEEVVVEVARLSKGRRFFICLLYTSDAADED